MFGKTRHQISYYACQPDPNEHRDQPWFPDHPKSLWVREEILITCVSRFFATRIFGPDRRGHLTAAFEAARSADGSGDRIAKERAALERAITAIGQCQARLIRTLADGFGGDEAADDFDPDQEKQFRDAIRREHATLGAQRQQLAERLAHLQSPKQVAQPADSAALLDALPHLDVDLTLVPEEIQRRLYNAFGLEVRYSRPREELSRFRVATDRMTPVVCATHEAPVPLREVFDVSTHRRRSLVGSLSCRTRPATCPGRVGHHAHRHP
ncbi:hypothetical protein RKD27_003180 [Streptomyces sp. SAI-126]|uniref:hypothetical protein n=1 Tax=Streptomyces sp. SAI-126 TaxID=3377732 RepID=UPI003C7B4198